ncbi:MAG: hypothetical protein IKL89_06040, partial [Clostridia bacterium]|nr:hypothetical protein [Clostridia bacterium]
LRIPLRPEFDYIEYFAESRVDCHFGAADVLSLKEGVLSGEKEWHGGLRRLSVSSGIVTLHIRPDRPMPFSAENGVLCFRMAGAARLKLSLESEIL